MESPEISKAIPPAEVEKETDLALARERFNRAGNSILDIAEQRGLIKNNREIFKPSEALNYQQKLLEMAIDTRLTGDDEETRNRAKNLAAPSGLMWMTPEEFTDVLDRKKQISELEQSVMEKKIIAAKDYTASLRKRQPGEIIPEWKEEKQLEAWKKSEAEKTGKPWQEISNDEILQQWISLEGRHPFGKYLNEFQLNKMEQTAPDDDSEMANLRRRAKLMEISATFIEKTFRK